MAHPSPASVGAGVEQKVLDVVAELVTELRAGERTTVARGESLEADLGISSLERVELLIRLERAFGVRLGDAAMASARTPADLASAIAEADDIPAERQPERRLAGVPASTSAATAGTIVEALAWHAERVPDRVHIRLREESGEERPSPTAGCGARRRPSPAASPSGVSAAATRSPSCCGPSSGSFPRSSER